MNKVYKYALLFIFMGVVYGCENTDVDDPQMNVGNDPIILSSVSGSVVTGTRAATNFPNDGNIGIVAATELNDSIPATDWSLYSDISNASATAVSVNGNVYSFEWDTQKYYPFDGSNLYFMAYSPVITGTLRYMIDSTNRYLFIQLSPDVPDIMYASNNIAPVAYNKTSGTVNLGEFKHALSQLNIHVIAGANLPSNIKVTNLTVSTTSGAANLFLPLGDDGLEIIEGSTFENVLVDGETEFENGSIDRELLLFPNTEDVTVISLTLLDKSNGISFTGKYQMSFFQSDNDESITLQRAKKTELRMVINITDVENPSETIDLEGRITDWTYKGQFGVNIN